MHRNTALQMPKNAKKIAFLTSSVTYMPTDEFHVLLLVQEHRELEEDQRGDDVASYNGGEDHFDYHFVERNFFREENVTLSPSPPSADYPTDVFGRLVSVSVPRRWGISWGFRSGI